MERPQMKVTGPVLNAPDVTELTRFYEELLGWDGARSWPAPGPASRRATAGRACARPT